MPTRKSVRLTDRELRRIVRKLLELQRDLEKYADQVEEEFHAALLRAQANTHAGLARLMQDAPDFKSLDYQQRLQWWVDHQKALEQAMDSAGYMQAASGYVTALPKFAEFVTASASAQGLAFVAFPPELVRQLQSTITSRFAGIGVKAEDAIKTIFYDEVFIGAAKSDALETLRKAIGPSRSYEWGQWGRGKYAWHATTYARTAHIRFARELGAVQAKELGIEDNFLYIGPLDEKTRPFCVDHVTKIYTKAEIDAMNNGQGADVADVMTNGGGWNCRHRFLEVTPGVADKLREKNGQQLVREEAKKIEQPNDPNAPRQISMKDHENWKPANTLEAAEQWARDNDLADTVIFEGLDLENANHINRQVAIVLREFPDARKKMRFLGSSIGYAATYRTNPSASVAFHAPGRGLAFNPEWFGPGTQEKYLAELPHRVASGFWAPDRGTIDQTVYHELGHLLDYAKGMRFEERFREIRQELEAAGLNQVDDLSEYSTWTDITEMFSESFMEYMLSPKPRKWATRIGEEMLQRYGVKK